jgi:26S proteasome regulatory subunit T5
MLIRVFIQVIAATNRVDILDPALLRSGTTALEAIEELMYTADCMVSVGRLDRKIEFPHPDEAARARIMQIHARKMNVKCVLAWVVAPL